MKRQLAITPAAREGLAGKGISSTTKGIDRCILMENLGEKFLKDYQSKTAPLLDNYLKKKIKEAYLVSKTSAELLGYFSEIAKRGKRLRGALVVLGYQIAGGKNLSLIYETSLFIELFHTAMLVHDDFMDKDSIRRGLTSLHARYKAKHYGLSMAVCGGDWGLYLAWERLLKAKFPADVLLKVARIFTNQVVHLIQGQVLDISNTNPDGVDKEMILKIYKYKTAGYSGVMPLLIGARLAGLESDRIDNGLRSYGEALGMCFQLKDDLLGVFGQTEAIGKPVGSDLREGKVTLLVWYVKHYGKRSQWLMLKRFLGKKNLNQGEISQARRIFKQTGALDYIDNLFSYWIKKGEKAIPGITHNIRLQRILRSLLYYVAERKK